MKKGFTMFVAIVVTATLLLVATGLVFISVRESQLASIGLGSQYAFYAADSILECMIYWDTVGVPDPSSPGSKISGFDPSTSQAMNCNDSVGGGNNNRTTRLGKSPDNPGDLKYTWPNDSYNLSVRPAGYMGYMIFQPQPFCAKAYVTKKSGGGTLIQAYGYNTCDLTNPRRVERAVKATY